MDAHHNDTAVVSGNGVVARLRGLLKRSPDVAAPAMSWPLLTDQLELELERAKRGARPLSVLVGESSSRAAEDGALVPAPIVSAVEREKRRIDTVATIAEDTFLLILPETGEQGALRLAERLRAAIAQAFDGESNPPSISFGIATFPRHGRTPAALTGAGRRAIEAVRSLGGGDVLLESAETPATMVSVGTGDDRGDQRLETLLALAETVDIRDQGRAGHSQTVARYAEQIARELGLPVRVADRVRLGGLLHDVGKVDVPEAVLQKPGPLDEGEWELVRRHPEVGARLIDDPELADVREWVLAHHEQPDGKGYPRGLRTDATPLEARIIFVADAYESMTTRRPYRAALSHEAAQAELGECSGTQFDQRVVQAFLRILEREGLRVRSRPPVTAG